MSSRGGAATSDARAAAFGVKGQSPYFEDADIEGIMNDVREILRSGRLVLGPYTKRFEEEFSEYSGVKHAVATSSCTSALEIALKYFDVRGKEVIVPANTFIACPNAVGFAGGKPVFADINSSSYCLDIDSVQEQIGPDTKGVMAVHIAGLPVPEMKALREICHDKHIFLLEDCSHAHGASVDRRKVGSLGDAGCFSFFATKILTTGTGGMITTDDTRLRDFAVELRHQGGLGREGELESFDKYGNDWMMSEVTAAIGISQLAKLNKNLARRREVARRYSQGLASLDRISFVPPPLTTVHAYWRFVATVDEPIDRDRLKETLRVRHHVEAGVCYPIPCHLQPLYRSLGHAEGECPVAEASLKKQITLPVHPKMGIAEAEYVMGALRKELPNSLR